MLLQKRRFLKRVDYITSPGFIDGYNSREKAGLPWGGPEAIITNKAIFRFDKETKEAYLAEISPGIKVKDVVKEVSWDLKVADNLVTMKPPTEEQIRLIHALDPQKIYTGDGLSKLEFESYIKMLEESSESFRSSGESYENYEVKVNTDSGKVCMLSTAQFIKGPQEERCGTVIVLNEFRTSQIDVRNDDRNEAKLTFKDILGRNKKFRQCMDDAQPASKSDFTVLLLGESGTGKDVFAQVIHNESNRRNGPFVAINCGAIPKELIASELFGYVSGSFTGARKGGSPGKFELADGGTIFLDEIGEMPADLQVYLLRVLQDRCVTRIGGQKCIPVNIRVIAATNSNLMKKVEQGSFRLDLYYRLNVISLEIPPLRERKDDLTLFIEQIYRNVSCCASDQAISIPAEYLRICRKYDWPGNIRELQNAKRELLRFRLMGCWRRTSCRKRYGLDIGWHRSKQVISSR
jgi:transcriptional regulator with PAS, ATPase and Fis domain